MAVIEAKYNDTPAIWDPLNPNNWVGDVVPGKGDVARFKRTNVIYSSYENNYWMPFNYDLGSNGHTRQYMNPEDIQNGIYSSSAWTNSVRNWVAKVNGNSGSMLGNQRSYGGSGDAAYHEGVYYNQGYSNIIGGSGSYTAVSENSWKFGQKNMTNMINNDRLPNRFMIYARTYKVYTTNRSNTSFIIDGVTIAEPLGLTGETYASMSRPFGTTKEQYLAAGGHPTMPDRLVDLFTGSALHVDNGGIYEIYGPHSERGITYSDLGLNKISCFTVLTTTGSEYNNSSYNSGPAFTAVSNAANNLLAYDNSAWPRTLHAFGFNGCDGFSGSNNALRDMDYPIWYWNEGTGSIKYGTPYTASNSGYVYGRFLTGSGHVYMKGIDFNFAGIGPGNRGEQKFLFDDPNPNYIRNLRPDTNYGTWSSASKCNYPLFTPLTDTGHTTNTSFKYSNVFYTDNLIQRWELTGSQEWEVGRIEMAGLTHFHVKDSSSIKIYDLEDGTYYPSIDIYDYAVRSTLLISDSATIETTSSRTSLASGTGYETGIYQRNNYTSVIISGSANYSSSVLASAATAGASTIEITDAQDNFGIGDYISLESTGSLEVTSKNRDPGLNYIDLADESTYFSGSDDEMRYRHGGLAYSVYAGMQKNYTPDGWTGYNNQSFTDRHYTHEFETDELLQIMSMSGDYITVGKMHGKEGEIQSDMGLYSYNRFAESFTDVPNTRFNGDKRVVLVDSAHLNFETDDLLVISGSSYRVLHATTYLSQSVFREFTSSTQPALEDVFDMGEQYYSASSIWPTTTSTYGISTPSIYFTEQFMKDRLLITGSYRGTTGSLASLDSFNFNSNAYGSVNYMGKEGSNDGYRALQLDPTQAYTWYNTHSSYSPPATPHSSYTWKYNNIYSTHYISGEYQLQGTQNFQRGEIIVSGSILRNGFFDPTSSVGLRSDNYFGITTGCIPQTGATRKSYYSYNYSDNEAGYQMPYPYVNRIVMSANYGMRVVRSGALYSNGMSLYNNIKSGSLVYPQYNNPALPYRYATKVGTKNIYDDPSWPGIDFNPMINDITSSWIGAPAITASMKTALGDRTGGTGHIRLTINDGIGKYYVGTNNKEVLIDKYSSDMERGKIGLLLRSFGSIYSVNVKTRWQQLILDTEDSFDYRDKIKEGGILYNQYAGKRSKFIATEVVDPKGFKNLLWDYEYEKGDTDILPCMLATCYTGTTAGQSSLPTNNGWQYMSDRYSSYRTLTPRVGTGAYRWNIYQANANFYIIYDFRTQVDFDTIGMVFAEDDYSKENDVNNQMNDITFQVCNDVGVASPAWETVVATYDDERYARSRGDIRFYTFPSGSVNSRYVKYHSRGGTKNAAYAQHSFFGVYDFSGSCASSGTLPAASIAGGFADEYGSPTGSMLQVELANTKNFNIGDRIFFWSKQMSSFGRIQSTNHNAQVNSYCNSHAITGYYTKATPEAKVIGGFNVIYEIKEKTGNIVTLDRPITHEHIGAGTMAFKYNRGNVVFKGDRAAPFFLFTYSSDNLTQQCSNVTFLNGHVQNYNANEYNGIRTYEDIGASLNQENYIWNAKPGLYRNIIGTIYLGSIPRATWDTSMQLLAFNTTSTYSGGGFHSLAYIRNNKSVINFTRNLFRNTSGCRVLMENYGVGVVGGKFYFRNNFMVGNYLNNHGTYGGVYIDFTYNPINNIKNLIDVQNTIVPIGTSYEFKDYNREGWNQGPYSTNTLWDKQYNTIDRNVFFFPNYMNPRMRGESYGYPSTVNLAGTSGMGGQNEHGMTSRLIRKTQNPRYNKDFITIHNNQYDTWAIVPNDDGENDVYSFSDYYTSTFNQATQTRNMIACQFEVKKDNTQVRIDHDFIYKASLQSLFGESTYSSYNQKQYNVYGNNVHCWMFQNIATKEILDITYLKESQLTDIGSSKTYTLNKGIYTFALHIRGGFYRPQGLMYSFKELDFKIVTANLSDIDIIFSNMDFLKLFDGPENYISDINYPYKENSGRNRVLQQSSDLTKNYKFNKIKM